MKLRSRCRSLAAAAKVIFWIVPLMWVKSMCSFFGLRKEGSGAKFASGGRVICVCPFHGNEALIGAFLDHHRRLGVDLFAFLDLSGTGNLWRLLGEQADCAVWRPRKMSISGPALYWLNYLRWRYARGRWCLSIDGTDFLVFHRSETRQIKDLADFLEGERRFHLYSVVIEMYGDSAAASVSINSGDNPLTKLPYFDAFGYITEQGRGMAGIQTTGGLQRRALFAENPAKAPALNRVPFLKWKWFYSYTNGTRQLTVPSLQTPHGKWHSVPTGCLLRCALLNDETSPAHAFRAGPADQATGDDVRSYAGLARLRQSVLKREISAPYRSTADLLEYGLLNPGQWF